MPQGTAAILKTKKSPTQQYLTSLATILSLMVIAQCTVVLTTLDQ